MNHAPIKELIAYEDFEKLDIRVEISQGILFDIGYEDKLSPQISA